MMNLSSAESAQRVVMVNIISLMENLKTLGNKTY